MTAELYIRNEIAKAHLARATVAIPQKDDQKKIIGYKPYISKEGRYDVAVDMWNPPSTETHEMRIIPNSSFETVRDQILVVATAEMQFRPRGSTDEAHWSTYFKEYGSAFIEKTNRDGGTYLVDDAIEKAVTGAIVRCYGLAGIGTSANKEDMPAQGNQQQRQAPQQQPQNQAPAAASKTVDPWPLMYTKLNDNQRITIIGYILKNVGCTSEDLQALVDAAVKKNKNVTAQQIYEQADAELGSEDEGG